MTYSMFLSPLNHEILEKLLTRDIRHHVLAFIKPHTGIGQCCTFANLHNLHICPTGIHGMSLRTSLEGVTTMS